MIFSFYLNYGGQKTWVEGVVIKQDDGSFEARSDLFPQYSYSAPTVHQAATGYRRGLPKQLDDFPDARVALQKHREQRFGNVGHE